MQEIIKSILSIDKKAIQKEEDCKVYLQSLEDEKQALTSQLKSKYETKLSQEVLELKKKLEREIEKESEIILNESRIQRQTLDDKFAKFESTVTEDSFKMILRNLED